jgi:hypothetical protein
MCRVNSHKDKCSVDTGNYIMDKQHKVNGKLKESTWRKHNKAEKQRSKETRWQVTRIT